MARLVDAGMVGKGEGGRKRRGSTRAARGIEGWHPGRLREGGSPRKTHHLAETAELAASET